ncbi:hypothetical protein [Salegentibacter salarius]|uniref:Uncharacterized protein n=1 Tax=Salegentibacter salarius TaxID=435906 RepID=A0A2N0TRI0_9FLAO|nr:hypothetical protein [Salegentibacter salarius]PKD17345.1 hypothetical protein APR40_03545 [Salegentibacter salarius]
MKNNKQIQLNRANKRFQRRLTSNAKRKRRRKEELGLSRVEKLRFRHYKKFRGFKKVKAPVNFSLVEEPEEMIKFAKNIKKLYRKKKKVFVIFKDTEHIGYDALVLLLSILIRFRSKRIKFDGDFPTNPEAKKILLDSGFFEYLYKNIKEEDRYSFIKGGTIATHAYKKVDPKLTSEIISDASRTIWKKNKRCQGVQRSLIELMHNTNNHAAYDKEGDKLWFLSVQHRKKEGIVSFSFLDFGVGIFESLNNKGKDSKWYNWERSLAKLFTYENNKELLKLILNGELHRTVTGKAYRGKGLPGIYGAFKRNHFNKLHIISNDVYADIENNKFLSLKNAFSGTFVYWEISSNNFNTDGFN